jgi:flavorubredoxin
MHDFLYHLKIKNFQNRRVAILENGSWAPTAGKVMRAMLDEMKSIDVVDPVVTIKSRMKESDKAAIKEMVSELLR